MQESTIPTADKSPLFSLTWPLSRPYQALLNATFIAPMNLKRGKEDIQHIFARDGMIPLLWYFWRNPTPPSRLHQLMVHETCFKYVPESWRDITLAYRLENFSYQKRLNKLLLCGMFCPQLLSQKILSKRLDEIKNAITKMGLKKAEITIVLFLKGEGWESKTSIELLVQISQILGENINYISWNKMLNIPSYSDFAVASIHDTAFCADSYFMHHAFSRGATALEQPFQLNEVNLKGSRFIPLTPQYGIRIYSVKEKQENNSLMANSTLEAFRKYLSTLSKPIESQTMPNWFIKAVRDSGLTIP